MIDNRILIAYFSHTGANYNVGYLHKGNTHIIAEMIQEQTGGALFEITPPHSYPRDSYEKCIEIAKQGLRQKSRPDLSTDIAVEDYDVIYLVHNMGVPTRGQLQT